MVAEWLAIILGMLGVQGFYTIFGGLMQQGITYGKWKAFPYETKMNKIKEVMQTIVNAEKHELTGLSAGGTAETLYQFVDKTLDFSWMISEGIASQLFVQMIQQSVAYAIHSSHGGAIGTIGNVYSGSMYLSGTQADGIGENADYLDRYLRSFLSAEVGLNKPTLTYQLVKGANTRIENMMRKVMSNADTFLDEWNDLALDYYRHWHSMARERFADAIKMKESATDKAYSLLEQVGNEHLARITEQLDTLEGAKAWWDGGLISDDDLKSIAIQVDLERTASELNYDEFETDITDAIGTAIAEWDAKITVAYDDLTTNETKYNLLIKAVLSEMFGSVTQFAEMIVGLISDSVEDVDAYRNIPVGVKVESQFTGIPFQKYELEVYVDSMLPEIQTLLPPSEHTCSITVTYTAQKV